MMDRDLRETAFFRETAALAAAVRRPGTGQISDAEDAHASPDGKRVVFAGALMDELEGTPPTRICEVELASGDTRVLTFGPHTDRLPRYAPDGRHIAFLSDRHERGDFQLYLLDRSTSACRRAPVVEGWVEYLHWSPNGRRILLGVAGHGADIAGAQGAVTSKQVTQALPSWMPAIETGNESYRWRRAWVFDVDTGRVRELLTEDCNVWEAAWCGDAAIAAVVSRGPREADWYEARLHLIDIGTFHSREIYAPPDQVGWPAASPSGRQLAIVDAVCSDRWVVAGDLRVIDIASGSARQVDTRGVDITYAEWRSENRLLLAGHRESATVIGLYDADSGTFSETWSSREITTGGRYVSVSGLNESGDCVLVGESFVRAPEIAVIRQGEYVAVRSFDLGYADRVEPIQSVESVRWPAPDGLEIQGWLLRPKGNGPHPLIMDIHGGPVWQRRPYWLGRGSLGLATLASLRRGYAIFFPNPRGSSGRGQAFARHVVGDMGGADTHDYLSGIDDLVARGIADPTRLGVTGGSYGGYMTSWLITQDSRFAAAVSLAPVTNQVTQHLVSNIPHFVRMFLADTYINATGKYFQRSPVMHAHKVRTPTLNICGALDRSTPPEEAVQFHNALLENGVTSVLVTYPEEGHGIRKFPAGIDYVARVVAWFDEHCMRRSER
jgi:dipeptidyl aminopeptidase/acylaminoacyl peptidase